MRVQVPELGIDYNITEQLANKLQLMALRCTQEKPKKDSLFLIEGGEGEGKTNSSVAVSYFLFRIMGRKVNLFFRLKNMIEFAQNTEKQIIIWDEPSLDSLSGDAIRKLNKDLMRLLMTCRVKRHFFIFNLTKFHKFAEYIVVDRGLGMIHMYSFKEKHPGRYVYIRKRNLENLYLGYKQKRKRMYKKYTSFHGNFTEVMEDYFNKMDIRVEGVEHATLADYDREKINSIKSIGEEKSIEKNKINELRCKIANLIYPIEDKEDMAKKLGVSKATLSQWKRRGLESPPKKEEEDEDDILDEGDDNAAE